MKLTPMQDAVLSFIQRRVRMTGEAPTRAEIATEFRFAVNAAECHVVALRRKGFIRTRRVPRGILVVAP